MHLGQYVNHFYIKYPKCWRSNAIESIVDKNKRKSNKHFNYEKRIQEETSNHRSILKEKTEQLRKVLVKKMEMPVYKKQIELFSFTNGSICTNKMLDLTKEDQRPERWTVIDELTNVSLEFCLKNTFKSYNTQKKPRIKVNVKYNPFRKLIMCCLKEIIFEDSKKLIDKYYVENPQKDKFSEKTTIEKEIVLESSDESKTVRDDAMFTDDNNNDDVKTKIEITYDQRQQQQQKDNIKIVNQPTTPLSSQSKPNDDKPILKLEELKFYEVDCTDTQRLNLNYNIYIGGWIEVKGKGYQIVPEEPTPSFLLLKQCEKHYKNIYFNGYKKSFCDIELIAFTDQIVGHNPNQELDLKNEKIELEAALKKIDSELEHHKKQYEKYFAKRTAENAMVSISSKYQKWIDIQTRRKNNITSRIAALDEKLKTNLGQWSKNVCQRVLFNDYECLTNGKTFPDAAICPIISMV